MRTLDQPAPPRAPRWSWWLVVIMMVGAGLPLLVAGLSGNLTIPHDDSWSYSKITEIFTRTGEIHLLGWNRSSLIGQVVMLGPLGRWLVVQQVAVAVLATLALYCVYYLVGQTLTRNRALLATLLVALWPGFASLATSFMSDIPALVGTLGSLALGSAALRRDSRRLLWLSLLVGAWATTVREQSLIAPATILAYGWLTSDRREHVNRRELILTGALLATSMIAFALWRQSLPRGDHPVYILAPHAVLKAILVDTTVLWFTLALALAPAVVYSFRDHRPSRPAIYFAGAVAAFGMVVHLMGYSLLAGSYMTAQGSGQRGGSSIFGSFAPGTLELVTWLFGVLLALAIVDRRRDGDPLLSAFTAATLLITLLIAVTGQAFNDRYLIVIAPGVLTILLADRRTPDRAHADQQSRLPPTASHRRLHRSLTLATLVALTVFSALLTLNDFAYCRALWSAATALVKAGVPAQRIDAGQVWDGVHAPDGVHNERFMYSPIPSAGMEPQLPCILVTRDGEIANTELAGHFHYKRFLLFGSSYLNIRTITPAPDCPTVDLSHLNGDR